MPLQFDVNRCTGCAVCAGACPFGAIEMRDGFPEVSAACRLCGLCVKACPSDAFALDGNGGGNADTAGWKGFLVVAEQSAGRLHPVTLELLGEALRLAEPSEEPVAAVLMGSGIRAAAEELTAHGAGWVYVYDDPVFAYFRADAYAPALVDCVLKTRPAVVLAGSTEIGRSLAPRAAARLRTGLTADCTELEYRDGVLTQIRPAFGGNIMARIVTPNRRPQFATVRYRVFDKAPLKQHPAGRILPCRPPRRAVSGIEVLGALPRERLPDVSDAEIIVAVGRGLKSPADMALIRSLAEALGGETAVTRPLAEAGFAPQSRQIGLSGRAVKPRLLFACGISGAIQFQAGMKSAQHIVAINTNPVAPIFEIAHYGIVGDLYEVIPEIVRAVKGGNPCCAG